MDINPGPWWSAHHALRATVRAAPAPHRQPPRVLPGSLVGTATGVGLLVDEQIARVRGPARRAGQFWGCR